MAPRSRKQRSSRGRSRRNATASTRSLRRQLHGVSLRVPADPPSTVDRPWNSAVLVMPLNQVGNVTIELVNSAFGTQIANVPSPPGILFRFLQVRAWELSGADIGLSLFDLQSGGDTADIRTQHDQPGKNHWARVGCAWPTTQQNDVCISTNTTKNLFLLTSNTDSPDVRVHLHLLWRNAGSPAPQKLQASLNLSKLSSVISPLEDSPMEID